MTIRKYEIAGLEVEVRMADGMESLIPAQFEVFRVEELESERVREWESRASFLVDGSESRYPDQSEYGGQSVDGGELLDDTANDMGRVRLFRLGSGEYLVRLTDLRGSDFEMIASEDFSRCLIRGKKGEKIEFRVGELESGELESGELESLECRASISVGGSENRDPDGARPTGWLKQDEARFITKKLDRNDGESGPDRAKVYGRRLGEPLPRQGEQCDPDGASGGGRAMAQSLQVDGPAMSVQQCPVGGREAVSSLIRIAFSQAVLLHGGVSIHASAVMSNGEGYMFLGASGTGKSTHSQLWIKNLPDTELLNDDNPIVRLMPDGTVRVFGSPWSGKTPCYRQTSAPLHGIVRLEQAPVNEFRSVSDIDAFAMLLPSCSAIKTSALLHNALCDTLIALSEAVATGVMRCRPDGEAARVCRERVSV